MSQLGRDLMARVARAIAERDLSPRDASAQIGVGVATLQNHLVGEHVRSDSMRKYEDWLAGKGQATNVFVLPATRMQAEPEFTEEAVAPPPERPRLVVDIFSGCGGLSLGFDLLDEGRHFQTILALDNQPAPIATLNRNTSALGRGNRPIGRVTDLTEFINGSEFLAFYLQHAAEVLGNVDLRNSLCEVQGGVFAAFLDSIAEVDQVFLEELNQVRNGRDWREAYERLDRQALNQTSVAQFHNKLRLPRPSLKVAMLPPLLWAEPGHLPPGTRTGTRTSPCTIDSDWLESARREWDDEEKMLSAKRDADGRGQLTASARRVRAFVGFLDSKGMSQIREIWMRWRAQRLTLRTDLFCDETFEASVRDLYSDAAQVSVLVGGPPCQGFSRIGRGKIRSLRDARVHAHGDTEAGDSRNLLFQQYVMALGALRPEVFLFENVQHFQSVVKAHGTQFQATEVLAEAIDSISDGEVHYDVASKVLDASRHGVPQTRQRYFMAGVRADGAGDSVARQAAYCLELRRDREAPLALALAGLPVPGVVGGDVKAGDAMAAYLPLADASVGDHPFVRWIRQAQPGMTSSPAAVDGHAVRAARSDDAAFFALMGPGRRWMDYRADQSPTMKAIGKLLDQLLAAPDHIFDTLADGSGESEWTIPSRSTIKSLRDKLDGSLPLRLLLEQAGDKLGATHHLLAESYLAKQDGNHGDWISRMDSSRPSKTMVSHMGKDTYAYVHPSAPRTISVREAARIQSFPDWFKFGDAALTDAFRMIGNAVPPMLSHAIANRVAHLLVKRATEQRRGRSWLVPR